MPNYRRLYVEGGMYFFTVNLLERHGNDLLIRHIDVLRAAVRKVKKAHPFTIHAFVVLPEHLHCVLEFPDGDSDFPLRWRLIKSEFSKSLPSTERRSAIRIKRGERGIWQRRFWEHQIRDDDDYRYHIQYTHHNPVKHGLVNNPFDWQYSTIHRYAQNSIL